MRASRPISVSGAFAGIFLMLVTAATADSFHYNGDTISVGGNGGGDFRDICPEGHALIGLNLTGGNDVDSVAAVCARFVQGAQAVGDVGLGTWGRPLHKRAGKARCRYGLGDAVQGIYVEVSRNGHVHNISLNCRNLESGAASVTRPEIMFDGQSVHKEWADCGGGAIAIGVFGRYGSRVDRIGLVCAIHAAPNPQQPTPVQPQTTTPSPQQTQPSRGEPLPVGGGNTGGGGGGGGANGRANSAVTAYAEKFGQGADVDYLEPGDLVTIIQCGNPEDWCEISAPVYGWVYAPQLDR